MGEVVFVQIEESHRTQGACHCVWKLLQPQAVNNSFSFCKPGVGIVRTKSNCRVSTIYVGDEEQQLRVSIGS